MLEGLFSAASGMVSMIQAQQIIINNIANVATPGFKKDIPVYRSFSTILQKKLERRESISEVEGTFVDFSQGEIESTGRRLDLAIRGEGFFALLTPQGIAYTRAGSFTLDNKGRLTTPQGYFLLGTRGPLTIPSLRETSQFKVSPEGEVIVGEKVIDRIRVEVFPATPFSLYKVGENLFKLGAKTSMRGVKGNYLIKQGYLELSNVDIVQEMVDLIANFRLYEAAQKAIQLQDATLGKICSELQ